LDVLLKFAIDFIISISKSIRIKYAIYAVKSETYFFHIYSDLKLYENELPWTVHFQRFVLVYNFVITYIFVFVELIYTIL